MSSSASSLAARLFREVGAEFGLKLRDPHHRFGDEDRCREIVTRAGLRPRRTVVETAHRFAPTPEDAWRVNSSSPHYPEIAGLDDGVKQAFEQRFIELMANLIRDDPEGAAVMPMIYVYSQKPAT